MQSAFRAARRQAGAACIHNHWKNQNLKTAKQLTALERGRPAAILLRLEREEEIQNVLLEAPAAYRKGISLRASLDGPGRCEPTTRRG